MKGVFEPGPDGNSSDNVNVNWGTDPREDRAEDGGTHSNG